MFSPLEQFEVITVLNIKCWYLDFSFVNIALPLFLTVFIVLFFHNIFSNNWLLVPSNFQLCCQFLYRFIARSIMQQMGLKGMLYFPLIFCIFFYILLLNLLSLFPFGIATTSHIVVVLYFPMVLWGGVFCIGLLNFNISFSRIFIPTCPLLLLILLIPIEIFSYVIRMFSLAIRLVANILAGHTLVYIITNFLILAINFRSWFYFLGVFILILVLILELGVAFSQAYIFTILFSIYLNDSVNRIEH